MVPHELVAVSSAFNQVLLIVSISLSRPRKMLIEYTEILCMAVFIFRKNRSSRHSFAVCTKIIFLLFLVLSMKFFSFFPLKVFHEAMIEEKEEEKKKETTVESCEFNKKIISEFCFWWRGEQNQKLQLRNDKNVLAVSLRDRLGNVWYFLPWEMKPELQINEDASWIAMKWKFFHLIFHGNWENWWTWYLDNFFL